MSVMMAHRTYQAQGSDFNRCLICVLCRRLPVESSLGIELPKVCPQVSDLFFILDAGEYLFGPGDLCLWIFDVFCKCLLIPDNSRIFVCVLIAEFGNTSGGAAVKSVEFGTDSVNSARADFVADGAFLKDGRAVVDVLRQRQVTPGD
jgi:hypothetical protein